MTNEQKFPIIKIGGRMELAFLKGLGPKNIALLHKLKIESLEDLMTFYPFRYNFIKRSNINTLEDHDTIIIDGVIEDFPKVFYINKKLNKLSFRFNIGAKIVGVTIFNRAFLKRNLTVGKSLTIIGKWDLKHNMIVASEIRFGKLERETIEPIYHTTYGLSNSSIQKWITACLSLNLEVEDYLPNEIISQYHFLSKMDAIKIIHHPNEIESLKKARTRLKYEELFLFMLKMNYLIANKSITLGLKRKIDEKKVKLFIDSLPFSLTHDQQKAIDDIYLDLISPKRMNRLIQGDVGSGKTVVSIVAIYINYLSGYQSALMAPTEILAKQHYETLNKFYEKFGIKSALLTGKMKVKERKELLSRLKNGEIDVIVGTHALFTDDVIYQNLGLVITDEQHRFGVNQRSNLKNKGYTPDVLYMSATPIPRTYALTLYGDMDISNIKTMPNGRKEIITSIKGEKDIKDVLQAMYEQLQLHHQIYVVAPLIEESENSDFENVHHLEEKMNLAFGKLYHIGVLHGKMKDTEKENIMNQFQENEIQILISTTVIEVGIDVKNATMMVIFDSYRFGLSALHQLRGRVGRSEFQSYCILISNRDTKRLEILSKTNDGFKISEEDFKLRGSGDLFGVRQSGDMTFHLADLKRDYNLLLRAKEDSLAYLKNHDIEKDDKMLSILLDSIIQA